MLPRKVLEHSNARGLPRLFGLPKFLHPENARICYEKLKCVYRLGCHAGRTPRDPLPPSMRGLADPALAEA